MSETIGVLFLAPLPSSTSIYSISASTTTTTTAAAARDLPAAHRSIARVGGVTGNNMYM